MAIKALILSYNHPEITKDCIRSTLSFFKDKDIYLIHNGSESKNIQSLKNQFPSINHLIIETNCGYTGGVNFGLRFLFEKFEEWVLFLSNDCVLQKIDLHPFSNNLNPAMLAPKIFLRKTQNIDSLGATFTAEKAQLRHLKTTTNIDKNFYVQGAAFVIHQEIWQQNGEFDENLNSYWEDVDYSMRAHQKNLNLKQAPEIEVSHKVGKTCHKNSYYTTYLFQRNRSIISQRYLKMHNPNASSFRLNLYLKLNLIRLILLNIWRGKNKEVFYLWSLLFI